MSWLVTQIWTLLVLSFALGALFGWLLRGWRAQKLAVSLLDARARHAADAMEQARQRSELNELRDRGKRLEAELLPLRGSNESLAQLRSQLRDMAEKLERAAQREHELDSEKAAIGAEAAAQEGHARALAVELELLRDRLRQEGQALARVRHELAQAQERLRHPPASSAPVAIEEVLAAPSSEAMASAALAPDDLQQIVGVGPKLKALLHALGIRHYAQIAHWSDADIDQAAAQLPGFGGRIRRDDWRGQCRVLHLLKYGSES